MRGDFLEVAQLDDCEVCYCREIEEREGGVLSDSTDGYCTTSHGEKKVRVEGTFELSYSNGFPK